MKQNRKLLNIELNRCSIEQYKSLPSSGLVLVADNIRSAHNVGSMFRTADAFKVDKLFLCGISSQPPSAQIHKSALGAEDSVDWEYCPSTIELVRSLKQAGYTTVSVEQTISSISLERFKPSSKEKYALVFGNEVDGVAQEVVDESAFSLEIPQYGTKHSLNVSVSVGLILWHFNLHLRY